MLELNEETTLDDFLDHSIRLTCALTNTAGMDKAFLKAIPDGVIFKTLFSYRGGIDPDPAFLLQGEDETVWFLTGEKNHVEFAALEQAAVVAETQEDDEDENEEGGLDFGTF